MFDIVHMEHLKGRKVLLETPSGFAVFLVKEFAFQEEKNIWVHFSDPEYAIQVLVALGFRKIQNRSIARNCNDGPGTDLLQLIEKFCKNGEELIVQDKDLKASIEKKLDITCICEGYTVGELMWGIKNVLHEFIHEERSNIKPEYCLPVSNGLQEALLYYSVNLEPEMLDKSFVSKFGFLRYLDLNLESFPKELLRSFDEYVGIGDTIKNGLDYAKVLAMVLVPELTKKYGFSQTFSPELASKLQQAKKFQAEREDELTMDDITKIMGTLDYLLNVPELRDKILMDVKLMEATRLKSQYLKEINAIRTKLCLDAVQRVDVGGPMNFNNLKFRKVLLQTPSGFAIFNVREDVFNHPENIWKIFSDIMNIVFTLGFVSVDDHSVVRDSVIGPGDKLRQLILRFCKANEILVVQDNELKHVIESKLGITCLTGEKVVELIWGLKYVLFDFIPKEKDKVTDEYVLPLSKQLLEDLKTYGFNVSTSKINAELIFNFGYMSVLDTIFKITSKALHDKCDQYLPSIDVMEDDLSYASSIAKILIPGSNIEIELAKITSGFGSKQINLPKDAARHIGSDDRKFILQCLEKLLDIYNQKIQARNDISQLLLGQMTIGDPIGATG